jgi:hypothetical protein
MPGSGVRWPSSFIPKSNNQHVNASFESRGHSGSPGRSHYRASSYFSLPPRDSGHLWSAETRSGTRRSVLSTGESLISTFYKPKNTHYAKFK